MKTFNILLIVLALSACKKNKDKTIPFYKVPSHLKQMLHYEMDQVVRFANGTGDTIVTKAFVETAEIGVADCFTCPTRRVETYLVRLTLSGTHRFLTDLSLNNSQKIYISIFSPSSNYDSVASFEIDASQASQLPCNVGKQTCLPQITLNEKTFTNVMELNPVREPTEFTKSYFNIQKGLVGFIHKNGNTYHLVEN